MKSLLPNCRFLCVSSSHQGRDWQSCTQEIDDQLNDLGMDLAEESTFLLYDNAPGSVIAGEARCQVARSVIGPKRNLEGRLKLVDWVQASIYRTVLIASDWDHILQECYTEWENLQRKGVKIDKTFMIVAKRRLEPELTLTLEVLFRE